MDSETITILQDKVLPLVSKDHLSEVVGDYNVQVGGWLVGKVNAHPGVKILINMECRLFVLRIIHLFLKFLKVKHNYLIDDLTLACDVAPVCVVGCATEVDIIDLVIHTCADCVLFALVFLDIQDENSLCPISHEKPVILVKFDFLYK